MPELVEEAEVEQGVLADRQIDVVERNGDVCPDAFPVVRSN